MRIYCTSHTRSSLRRYSRSPSIHILLYIHIVLYRSLFDLHALPAARSNIAIRLKNRTRPFSSASASPLRELRNDVKNMSTVGLVNRVYRYDIIICVTMLVGIFDVCDWRPIVWWWLQRCGRNAIAHVIRDTDATNAYYYTLYNMLLDIMLIAVAEINARKGGWRAQQNLMKTFRSTTILYCPHDTC